ncbi:MAG TPA: vanadium-dependent haloperoxidase [Gemmatimonadales bacterium]|nr:vanadium-dependent haloperoxidase [Gemmatimonadales bacterium]
MTCLALAIFIGRPAALGADVVVTWLEVAEHVEYDVAEAAGAQRTAVTARAGAQVALAMFEAANAVDRRYSSFLGTSPAAAGTSAEAAVASAAHTVITTLFPNHKTPADDALVVTLGTVPEGPEKTAGVELGKRVAAAVIARAALPAGATFTEYRPRTAPGVYIDPRLPSILPFDTAMPPFFMKTAADVRPAGPPALSSEQYARDLDEVRRLGAKHSTERPKDQTLLVSPWLNISYPRLLGDVARQPGRSLVQNARLYAMTLLAMDDTWLAIMDAKMHFATWRPITAIRNADQDGNDATTRDAAWEPLLRTPTHPDYPCGHCGVAAAAATVLEAETGPAPSGGIWLRSYDKNPGMRRVLPTWKAFVDEMSLSRIYAGAHTRFANEAAEAMGRELARRALAGFMRPLAPGAAPATAGR